MKIKITVAWYDRKSLSEFISQKSENTYGRLVIVVGSAVFYIWKEKKKGNVSVVHVQEQQPAIVHEKSNCEDESNPLCNAAF